MKKCCSMNIFSSNMLTAIKLNGADVLEFYNKP
jgi:hypothetical protein